MGVITEVGAEKSQRCGSKRGLRFPTPGRAGLGLPIKLFLGLFLTVFPFVLP